MNIIPRFSKTSKPKSKLSEHLEAKRWHGHPTCPYCQAGSVNIVLAPSRSLSETIFHGTHVPLKQWFIFARSHVEREKVSECLPRLRVILECAVLPYGA